MRGDMGDVKVEFSRVKIRKSPKHFCQVRSSSILGLPPRSRKAYRPRYEKTEQAAASSSSGRPVEPAAVVQQGIRYLKMSKRVFLPKMYRQKAAYWRALVPVKICVLCDAICQNKEFIFDRIQESVGTGTGLLGTGTGFRPVSGQCQTIVTVSCHRVCHVISDAHDVAWPRPYL